MKIQITFIEEPEMAIPVRHTTTEVIKVKARRVEPPQLCFLVIDIQVPFCDLDSLHQISELARSYNEVRPIQSTVKEDR